MITFIHTADWQLGKPFARVADDGKRMRLQEQRIAAIRRIGEVVQKHNAAFIVVAGDVFDSNSPSNTVVADACDAIKSINVPVYVIPGNHDHAGPGSVWSQPFFLRVSKERASNLRVLLDQQPVQEGGYILFPCPLSRRQSGEDPCTWIRNQDFSSLDDRPRIVLAHGSTLNFRQESDEEDGGRQANLVELDRMPLSEIDYVALGDWHGMKQVGPKAWYSGTPELDRFPKGEANAPGHVLAVIASHGAAPQVTPIQTARFRWHHYAFDFIDDEAFMRIQQHIDELIENRVQEDFLRLELTGSLGIEATTKLEQFFEALQARLLRLKLSNGTVVAPTPSESNALTQRAGDPLISRVATQLVAIASGSDERAVIARVALRELHAACIRQ